MSSNISILYKQNELTLLIKGIEERVISPSGEILRGKQRSYIKN